MLLTGRATAKKKRSISGSVVNRGNEAEALSVYVRFHCDIFFMAKYNLFTKFVDPVITAVLHAVYVRWSAPAHPKRGGRCSSVIHPQTCQR